MEMTPGQIMEAEISATLLENPSSPFQTGSLTTVLTNESDQVCASLPDNVFSVSSPGPSCPGLDSDFDQVIQTDQVINTDHHVISTSTQLNSSLQQSSQQSHVSPANNLPADSTQPTQSPHDNTRLHKTGRRRSGRSELSQQESKKIRLSNGSENVQLSPNLEVPGRSTNVHPM